MKTPTDIMRIAKEVSPQAANLLTMLDALEKVMGLNKAKQGEKTQPQRLLESIIPNKAVQVCNAGDWPDHLPSSFSDWLKSNNDAIDIGGNEIPDRRQANHDRYDLPF